MEVARSITCWGGSVTAKAQRCSGGNPEEVRELIDSTPFSKKYTSGVLSFAEKELPPGERERVMTSFERVLMPGLEKASTAFSGWNTRIRGGSN